MFSVKVWLTVTLQSAVVDLARSASFTVSKRDAPSSVVFDRSPQASQETYHYNYRSSHS